MGKIPAWNSLLLSFMLESEGAAKSARLSSPDLAEDSRIPADFRSRCAIAVTARRTQRPLPVVSPRAGRGGKEA